MIYIYIFIIMIFSWSVSLFTDRIPRRILQIFMFIIVVSMVLIAATKPGTSTDYDNYYRMFIGYDDPKYELTTEPTYLYISQIILSFGGSLRVLMWVYAFLSIPLKMYFTRMLSSYDVFFAGLPVYLSFFFTLHDCEQIRIAAALSFVMICFYMRCKGMIWQCVPIMVIAVLFHYSSAAMIIPVFFTPLRHLGVIFRYVLLSVVLLGVVLWILQIDIVAVIPIPALQAKLALYEMTIAKGEHPEQKAISVFVIIRFFILIYTLYFYETVVKHVKGVNFLIVNQCLALFFWFALRSMSVFAVRVAEMFEMTDFILWGVLPLTIRPMWVGKVIVFVVALLFFIQGIIYNQFGFL